MNLIDRFLIDDYVGRAYKGVDYPRHGRPQAVHHRRRPSAKKWLFGTVGMAVIAAVLSGIMALFVH